MSRPGIAVLAAVAATFAAAAPTLAQPSYPYTLYDVGTFGGPNADVGNGPYLSATGFATGTADTAEPDPFGAAHNGAFNGGPFVQRTWLWPRGRTTDLGALGPGDSSYPNGINSRGDAAGLSDTGAIDPLTGQTAVHAVLWRSGRIQDLGTLGGNQSQTFDINDAGQVAGVAGNRTPDAFSMLGWGTQTRAFLWQRGRMRDLGTLGGPDAFGWFINSAGQIAGISYTSATPDPATKQPPSDAFLWDAGHMRDLGNLGGSVPVFGGVTAINRHGQVVGQSDLAADQTAHPYLWNGHRMIDLGTLGGDNGSANAVNADGVVVGTADLADGTHRGFIWAHGRMHDLPPVNGRPCSFSTSVNDRGQTVGSSTICHPGPMEAVLWQHGTAVDLNTLIAPSTLHLNAASFINDAGDIVGEATLPNGNVRNFVLLPNH